MSNATLYLIQSNYAAIANTLNQLKLVLGGHDQVVFLGESVLCLNDAPAFIQNLKSVFVLDNEADLLTNPASSYIQVINYAAFAELCLQYTRCISMK